MIITTIRSDLYVRTQSGNVKFRVGSYNYDIDHKDPSISTQLNMLRKHRGIAFDELLDNDVEVLRSLPAKATDGEKKAALLKANSPKNQKKDLKPKKEKKPKPDNKAKKEKKIVKIDPK